MVSIIIPAYNSAEYLPETLQSVVAQTYRPIELLVVDDGSTDATVVLVKQWLAEHAQKSDFRGRLLRQTHRGGAAARNLGLAQAEGEWIQFLDADDTLARDKLSRQIALLSESSGALTYCSWRYLHGEDGNFRPGNVRQATPLPPDADPLKLHLEGWFCPIHGYLWPRQLLQALGGFDSSLAADQDAELLMRALVSGTKLVFTPDTEVQYRLHDSGQISRSVSRSKLRSRLRVVKTIAGLLEAQGSLESYRESLAIRCDELERSACLAYPAFARLCRRASRELAPNHRPLVRGGLAYRLTRRVFGLYLSEWLSRQKRQILARGPQ